MVFSILALVVVWLTLVRTADWVLLLIGVVISGSVALVQRHLFPTVRLFPLCLLRRPQWLLAFLGTLVFRFIMSTLYTSRLILSGGEEGRIVALPTKISDPLGQFLLLNSITLTPSTISLLLEGDLLYIHWLSAKGERGDWRRIKGSLEARLHPIFARSEDAHR